MSLANKYILLIILFISLIACEKIVDVDLSQAEPRNVIDASIKENAPCVVILTQSQAFYNNDPYNRITGAVVELTDDKGNTEVVKESNKEAGIYFSSMMGEALRTYHLKVTIGGDVYEAKATIPEAVPIDSMYIYDIKMGKDHYYSPCIVFNDPPDVENYYYTMLSVNGKTMKTIYLDDDEFRNGLKVENILFFDKEDNNDEELKVGDQIKVEMQSLDKGMYTFFKSLRSVAAGGATNPLTNFSGGALGCFKAYDSGYKEMTITEADIAN
ncbi:MAG: DUF4249 domain-containing protein [Prevotella sp.]|jgi:hypothetical protein|nr:DUF4249 domain-containing protein [Prevotella sp.]